jgi:NADH:ubiquinone oxidoreductase subunit 3 (subunit A)
MIALIFILLLVVIIVLLIIGNRRPNSVKEARYQLKQDVMRQQRPLLYLFIAFIAITSIAQYVYESWH